MKHELPSGAYIDVTPLPYAQAWEVAQTLLRVIEQINVDLHGIDLEQLMATDVLVLKGPICALLGSRDIQSAVKLCFTRCCYSSINVNPIKIDDHTFEPVERRGDFLFCAFYALKENVFPFFGSLASFLKTS